MKIDQDGNKLWDLSIPGGKNDWGWDIIETINSKLVITGATKSYGAGLYDILIAKIDNPE